MSVRLRPATPGDVELVFGWRNAPAIVARGSSQRTVARDEHERWFAESLGRSDRLIFIVECDGEPAGQVRFDRSDERRCVISAYLVEGYIGRGLGVEAIRIACRDMFGRWNVEVVVACVRHANEQGRKAFIKAGFVADAAAESACAAEHYALRLTRPA